MLPPPKPSKSDLLAGSPRPIPDVIAGGLRVLFVGINPGLYSAAIGCHFGRPGNRFWPALFAGGFTPRLFQPWEQELLLPLGLGVTNIVPRASARADELAPAELVAGGKILTEKVRRNQPKFVAILGVTAYRQAFGFKSAGMGLQPQAIGGATAWVLPNPSGLNAHYQAAELGRVFAELQVASRELEAASREVKAASREVKAASRA